MTDDTFVHLHVHTEYSLLDGLSQINRLVSRAQELEMPALAITDHGTMFGVIDFYRACTKAGVKPIIGVEAYLARRGMEDRDPKLDRKPYHMLLLAKNQTGYKNLLKLSSEAQLRGYYYQPRIDRDLLAQYSEGIVATSGCLGAQIPGTIMDGNDDEARELIGWYQEVFGAENFYLELQYHDIDELERVNNWLTEYRKSGHTPVQFLATNDVHYVLDSDHDPHDTMLCIQTSAVKADPNRMRMSDPSYHLTSHDEMMAVLERKYPWLPPEMRQEAVYNTSKVAAMCEVNLDTQGYHLPVFPVPPGFNAETYLRYLVEKGLREWRFADRPEDPVLHERINSELAIIHSMGFDTYFLIVWDLCQYARQADIWWNVRGSGAGSLVAYCLGITNIDPIENNLLFERFLNPGRVSMPDIDMDFPDDRRGEMIEYSARKYGADKVAAIITFGTMGAKAAVRDVGRALDVDLELVNQAARLIPQEAKQKPLQAYVEMNPELESLVKSNAQLSQVFETAKLLQGISRHASTHAAGIIVSDKPLVEYVPLHRLTSSSDKDENSESALKAVTQFPMETCESLGLLKVDFLGLSTLTILRKACDLIERYHGIKFTMDNIPYRHREWFTDEQNAALDAAFALMGRGETVGVFQLESTGMQQTLRGMRPTKFEHVIAAISLYRPGPMEFIPQYNARMHGKENVEYKHGMLEGILSETYGIIVYQEQLMQIAGQLFGYELGEADLMRRAVSKKKEKELAKHKAIFLERGPERGIPENVAEEIFADIEFFANYGFNKSHAADYAVITVQTAFLKAHYPEEYMTALLSVQRDDSTKVATFLGESRRMGIPILPPDVNYSLVDFDIQDQGDGVRAIRYGLGSVKNASAAALQHIIDARLEGGRFADLQDFCTRVDLRQVGKRTVESLIKVGAMQGFGKRSVLLEALEQIMHFSGDHHQAKEVGQMTMFGGDGGFEDNWLSNMRDLPESPEREMLGWEKELLGLYVTRRPADKFKHELQAAGNMTEIYQIMSTDEAQQDRPATIAGEVVELRKLTTKKHEMMAVAVVEDWHETAATIDVVMFPRTWEKLKDTVEEGKVMWFSGKIDTKRGDPQIICDTASKKFEFLTSSSQMEPVEEAMPAWTIDHEDTGEDGFFSAPTNGDYDPMAFDSHVDLYPPPPVYDNGHDKRPAYLDENEEWGEKVALEEEINDELPKVLVEVKVYRSDDPEKDKRLIKRLHRVLTSYPGHDYFRIRIYDEDGKTLVMNFDEDRTFWDDDLRDELMEIVGFTNIRVIDIPS